MTIWHHAQILVKISEDDKILIANIRKEKQWGGANKIAGSRNLLLSSGPGTEVNTFSNEIHDIKTSHFMQCCSW